MDSNKIYEFSTGYIDQNNKVTQTYDILRIHLGENKIKGYEDYLLALLTGKEVDPSV